jgi:hypothetical protein
VDVTSVATPRADLEIGLAGSSMSCFTTASEIRSKCVVAFPGLFVFFTHQP